uniref:Uncharacterized protein n=1 Tax=Candidatus Kentrum sp. TUN TaxID=2126343 RepID=A0A451AD56_9GAMM|nr:MAG: hypothetical protein BECKTUN1418F_GA0071002_11984 [Candidatus Kentron sp. TUN]VFK63976.1 MAG: hypothetical protein BECKTUN1418D_GA0071000_12353 [Candidatus Kentron sp. TUN]VFK69548.1 MAG: hypothetical protein BECKTUN1418E_GA0071001_11974 [Candidatus Kentron sp. TUN]
MKRKRRKLFRSVRGKSSTGSIREMVPLRSWLSNSMFIRTESGTAYPLSINRDPSCPQSCLVGLE